MRVPEAAQSDLASRGAGGAGVATPPYTRVAHEMRVTHASNTRPGARDPVGNEPKPLIRNDWCGAIST